MSLFGTGRGDGFLAGLALVLLACGLSGLTMLVEGGAGMLGNEGLRAAMLEVHAAFADGTAPLWRNAELSALLCSYGAEVLYPPWWLLGRGSDALWLPALTTLHTAVACALAYRLLRAHGRSRYAAFVGGALYGLGAFAASLHGNITELAAMAWAPLPLAVVMRVVRGERHRRKILWLGPAMALPMLTGGTATACLTLAVGIWWLVGHAINEPDRRRHLLACGGASLLVTACLTAPIWLGIHTAASQPAIPTMAWDWAQTRQLLAGPLLLFLILLGVMRSQREAPPVRWLIGLTLTGLVAVWLPHAPWPLAGHAPWQDAPDATWWPVHLLLVLFAASSLDDFLDLPRRRRSALLLTILLALTVPPLTWWYVAEQQIRLIEVVALAVFALLFANWRRLGMPRFKAAVACTALAWLFLATLYEPLLTNNAVILPAAPAVETWPIAQTPGSLFVPPGEVLALGCILAACGVIAWCVWLLRATIPSRVHRV
ncbi:MAG: hypothetical protein VYE77_09515 [Planctomycetota bacterium]|nr:hypothetical protein [Planctomycetota bacterium]